MPGDGARDMDKPDWFARVVAVVGLLAVIVGGYFTYQHADEANDLARSALRRADEANAIASEANKIALQAYTSTVVISSVSRESWHDGILGSPAGVDLDGQSHADLVVTFSNRGGLAVSLINAELLYRWRDGYLVTIASAEAREEEENVVRLECAHDDSPIELPVDIDPGVSRKLRFSAVWTASALPDDVYYDLAERIPGLRGLSHGLVWKFFLGNEGILPYYGDTIPIMTNTP